MTRPTVGKHGVRHGYVALAEGAHGRCVWVGAGLGCVTFENVSVEAVNRCAFLLLCFLLVIFSCFRAGTTRSSRQRRKIRRLREGKLLTSGGLRAAWSMF